MRHLLVATVLALSVQALPALADPAHCPPGHAKKGWCSPAQVGWQRGQAIPRDRYVIVTDYDRRGLPRPTPGAIYVSVDRDLLLIAAATGVILDVLNR